MRIGKTLGLAALGAVLLAGCNEGSGGSSANNSTAPGSLAYSPPLRIASLSATALAAQLNASATGQQLLAIAGTPKCGVDFHLINYATVGGAGEATRATGALMAPTGGAGCTGARPIVEYAHGTATTSGYNIADPTATTNEANTESVLVAAMFAAQGYIVVAPNYVGYDQPDVGTLTYHPYLNRTQNAHEMLDALTAARTALAGGLPSGVSDGGKLFLTGYSEGGYVAMAAHRAMQAAGLRVTAAAPMSGPYATEALGDAIVFGNVDLGSTVFLPLITESYQHAYGNIYAQPGDVYETTYSAGIDTLLPNAQPIATIFTQGLLPQTALFSSTPTGLGPLDALTTTAQANPLFALGFGSSNLIKNSVRVAYATDAFTQPDGAVPPTAGVALAAAPTYPLRLALNKNDMRSWTPNGTTPILLCGGQNDPTVFYSVNTSTMLAYWSPLVGTLVNEADVDPVAPSMSFPEGLASEISLIAAGAVGAAELGGTTDAATLANDALVAVVSAPAFSAYFSGGKPILPAGIVVAGAGGVAAQVVAANIAAGTTDPTTIGTNIGNAIVQSYHGTLIPPACTVAARAFFANFL
jgi:hypothetical protein